MSDPDDLRAAAMRVSAEAETDDNFDGEYIAYLVPAEAMHALRAALAAEARPGLDWPTLANVIREVDGNHDLGAGELAQRILDHPRVAARLTKARP